MKGVTTVLLAFLCTLAACSGHAGSSAVALPSQGGSGQPMKLQFRLDDSIYATSVAWSPDGRYIATSSIESNLVHVWDVKSRALAREFDIGSSNTNYHDISWSPNGRYLAVCGPAHLHVYRSSDWSEAFNVGHEDVVQAGDRVYDIAVNPTSTQFAAATGRKIEVWSLPTGR